jgi:rare lipoprotein A
VSYQPPPPLTQPSESARSRAAAHASPRAADGASQAASAGNSDLEPHGRPVSSEVGLASWYGPPYNNRKGADGTIYDQNAMTAAHRELPLGTVVRVTNLTNNESVLVKITDRGPFIDGRIIDLSLAAAKAVDVYRPGVAKVRVEAYAPPVRAGVDPAGKWCVQIGAFFDPADAIQLKNDLLRRYGTAKVIEFAGPTGHWVRIDPKNDTRTAANQIADSIHIPDPGAQPYIVRLN